MQKILDAGEQDQQHSEGQLMILSRIVLILSPERGLNPNETDRRGSKLYHVSHSPRLLDNSLILEDPSSRPRQFSGE